MNDSTLFLADMHRSDPGEDHTPEGALMHGEPPLLNCRGDLNKTEFLRRVMAIAREYLVDYDLMRAAARCGIDWSMVRYLERDPTFITALDMLRRELKPDEIVTRSELLNMLKREATTAASARDRIAAVKELARIAGFTIGEDERAGGAAPVININLTPTPGQPLPAINVTPQPAKLAPARPMAPEEEML